MSDKFPDHIDPLLFAERRSVLAGELNIATLERLADSVVDRSGTLQVRIEFGKEGKRVSVSGHIGGDIQLECQSCLQALAWPVDISFKLSVVSSLQEAKQLDDSEPLMLDGDTISLTALIEDEILLALPDYPRHPFECIERNRSEDADYGATDSQIKANNPFSVLAKLKKTGD
ncbi:YceD family protein [Methylomonas sp. SURF-1]|uniref:Large ribosomal RNA subunit accumulation protein YceD n=1 Tax=Methylomonas aurea TaxID=2952224 RepID=A0ABT1UEG0_9GAMM|nr:YceD family protein [Methylomonas sp. SURF-1]MCQ8180614.1 YceD family protein [Methylomonas sp. SURF-1]